MVTRRNPNKNTYDTEIQKRYRAPNKAKQSMENPIGSNQNSVGAQTENEAEHSNVVRGRDPIEESRHALLFQHAEDPKSQYRLNLQQLFGKIS